MYLRAYDSAPYRRVREVAAVKDEGRSSERAVTLLPRPDVLARFGVGGEPIALDGGEGLTFRVEDVVLKRVHDTGEAELTQELLSRVEQDGFRTSTPIPSSDGRWVHDGWSASTFLEGLRPAVPAWAA